jgi:hypothetical protein
VEESESSNGSWQSRLFKVEPLSVGQLVQIGASAAVGLAVVRLLRVAEGDPRLAVAILQESGYIGPIVGIFIGLVPFMALYFLMYFVEYRMALGEAGRAKPFSFGPIVVILWGSLFFLNFATWYYAILGGTLVVLYSLADKGVRKRARAPESKAKRVTPEEYLQIRRRGMLIAASAVALPLVFNAVISNQSWRPSEVVTASTTSYQGMVLRQDDKWLTILVDKNRHLEYIPIAEVTSRQMCKSQGQGPTLFQLLDKSSRPGGINCK